MTSPLLDFRTKEAPREKPDLLRMAFSYWTPHLPPLTLTVTRFFFFLLLKQHIRMLEAGALG